MTVTETVTETVMIHHKAEVILVAGNTTSYMLTNHSNFNIHKQSATCFGCS